MRSPKGHLVDDARLVGDPVRHNVGNVRKRLLQLLIVLGNLLLTPHAPLQEVFLIDALLG